MKVAISQSNYIPWKGYFDLINKCDVFVFYDDAQYTKRDWRNRNKIKTPNGLVWMTIPVEVKGKFHQKINETKVSDMGWVQKHLRTIELNYKKAAFFGTYFPEFEKWYKEVESMTFLSEVNHFLLSRFCELFGINTKLVSSSEYVVEGSKTDALISILDQIDQVDTYISGSAAKVYLDFEPFKSRNIEVEWMEYKSIPEYPQVYGDFDQYVSILDFVLNCGVSDQTFNK